MLQVVEFLQHLKTMKRGTWLTKGSIVLLFGLFVFLQSHSILGQTLQQVLSSYRTGELDQAKQTLLNLWAEQQDNPEILLLLGKTEEKGELSESYLQKVVGEHGDWPDSDKAHLLLCKYEFCRGMHLTTVDLADELGKSLAQSEIMPEVLWLSGCSYLAMEKTESALAAFDRILTVRPLSLWAPWAQLGKGDCLLAKQNHHQAIVQYHKVLDEHKDCEAFPLALSGLVRCYSQLEDSEKALLYYNLLKERFPLSVESVEMFVRRLEYQRKAQDESRAEEMAGVKYTVQLGVFGVQENAARLRSELEEQGYSVRIKTKLISGKSYSVVQIGSFTSYEEALEFKKRLESQTGESYRVVIR